MDLRPRAQTRLRSFEIIHHQKKDPGFIPAIVAIAAFCLLIAPEVLYHFFGHAYREYYPLVQDWGFLVATIGMVVPLLFARGERSVSRLALAAVFCVVLLYLLQLGTHKYYGRFSEEDLTFTRRILFCCLSLWLIPSVLRTSASAKLYPLFLVAVAVILSVYSLYTETGSYLSLAGVRSAYAINITSIFYNRNAFGQLLMMSFFAVFLVRPDKRGGDVLLLSFLFLVMTATLARAALLGVVVFLFFYAWMNMSIKPIFFRVMIIGALLFVLALLYKPSLYTYISQILLRGSAGDTGRSAAWWFGLQQQDTLGWLIGSGMQTSLTALQESPIGMQHYHSYYIGNIVAGGFLLCAAHLFLFLEFLGLYEKMSLTGKKRAGVYLCAVFAFYAYAFFDNAAFLIPGYEGIYITFLLLTIPLCMTDTTYAQPERSPHVHLTNS